MDRPAQRWQGRGACLEYARRAATSRLPPVFSALATARNPHLPEPDFGRQRAVPAPGTSLDCAVLAS